MKHEQLTEQVTAHMHISDGLLNTEVCLATGVISAGFIGYSIRQLNHSISTRTVPLTGMVAAIIFAAQMVNFPLIGVPVSGHLLGGVLAAVILGPYAGCLALTAVLLVQCFLFSDGGILSLGANTLHMGVIGSIGGYAIYSSIRHLMGYSRTSILVGTVVASWLTVMAAAALFCLEFFLSYRDAQYDFSKLFTLMVTFHSLIGIGEAIISGLAVSYILNHRPDLFEIKEDPLPAGKLMTRLSVSGLVVALSIAAFLSPLASGNPDGLEAAAEMTGINSFEQEPKVFFLSDYEVPIPSMFAGELKNWEWISVSLAGILGTVVVFFLAFLFSYFARKNQGELVERA